VTSADFVSWSITTVLIASSTAIAAPTAIKIFQPRRMPAVTLAGP
jgi:hypothetical protein